MTLGKASFFGIYERLVITTVIPLLSFAVLVGYYMLSSQAQDIKDFQNSIGELAVQQAVNHSGPALADYDIEALKIEADHLFKVTGVEGLLMHNFSEAKTFAIGIIEADVDALPPGFDSGIPWEAGGHLFFFREIHESIEGQNTILLSNPIGYVVVSIDTQLLMAGQKEKILNTILVIVFSLFVASWLAVRFTRSISQPIESLHNMVEKMMLGELDTLAEEAGPREVQLLANGINQLAVTIRDSNFRMESEITKATAQLHATLVELEEVAEAQNQFLARMSHELRTPLTAVIGFSRLVASEENLESRKEYLSVVDRSSTMLLTMIDDILEFSKAHFAGFSLERINFDISKWLVDVIAIHQQGADEKNLSLSYEVIGKLPSMVRGDPVRLAQVVSNLLGNAIKFTDKGYVALYLQIDAGDQNGMILRCSIRDSGKGMDTEKLALLFEPFAQEDVSINRRFGGAGLGLSICKKLVNLMDGEITINSKVNHGSIVSFTSMLYSATSSQLATVNLRSSSTEILNGVSILVAEDNHFSRRLIVKLLKGYGAECLVANNGLEATEIARLLHIDVVLMDIHMPVVDGISACESIVNQSSASPPVIGLTADITGEGEAKMLESGADIVLIKPLDEVVLVNTILSALNVRKSLINGDDPGLLSSLIPVAELRDTLDQLLEGLERQLRKQEKANLQQLLHDILGLSGLYGMTQFREKVLSFKMAYGGLSAEENLVKIASIRHHVAEFFTADSDIQV
jgi:signal transduction histidine kinase/CheY-like chemotaxis protein